VVQLNPAAGPPQHPAGRQGVQRERHRGPRVVDGQRVPARLVIHHGELAGVFPGRGPPHVQPVDPAGHRDPLGAGADRPLHAGRLG